MFNNEITYADKWDTQENADAQQKLQRFLSVSECRSHVPDAWAVEVLQLLEKIDDEIGIIKSTERLDGLFIEGDLLKWFIVRPWSRLYLGYASEWKAHKKFMRIRDVLSTFAVAVQEGFSYMKVLYVNPILNAARKPRFRLIQVKEKHGQLMLYFKCPDIFESWVERQIRETEVRLSVKGAYYPPHVMWNWTSSHAAETPFNLDTVRVSRYTNDHTGCEEISVYKTMYRQMMSDLGLDVAKIAADAAPLETKDEV